MATQWGDLSMSTISLLKGNWPCLLELLLQGNHWSSCLWTERDPGSSFCVAFLVMFFFFSALVKQLFELKGLEIKNNKKQQTNKQKLINFAFSQIHEFALPTQKQNLWFRKNYHGFDFSWKMCSYYDIFFCSNEGRGGG